MYLGLWSRELGSRAFVAVSKICLKTFAFENEKIKKGKCTYQLTNEEVSMSFSKIRRKLGPKTCLRDIDFPRKEN